MYRLKGRVIGTCVAVLLAVAACGGSSSTKAPAAAGSGSTSVTTTVSTTSTTGAPQDVVTDKALAQAAALKLSDLPAGWTSQQHTNSPDVPSVDTQLAKCLGVSVDKLNQNGPADADSPDFSDANNNSITNSLGYTPSAAAAKGDLATFGDPRVPGCLTTALGIYLKNQAAHPAKSSDTLPPGVTFGTAAVAPMSFPTIGDGSVAYRVNVPVSVTSSTITVYVDLIVATKGRAGVEMDFTAIGTPFPADQEQRLISVVVGRLSNT
jgi:hypothetical protein